jgi:catechol 2,3-dioxygenase-like lactoylglutathione lyase family enzyme
MIRAFLCKSQARIDNCCSWAAGRKKVRLIKSFFGAIETNADGPILDLEGLELQDCLSMTDWFARPVIHVTDVEASIHFYVSRLGFTSPWRYEEDGRARVAQVQRQGCVLILADTWPEKIGRGLMFISVNVEQETSEAAIAALDELRAELEAKGVSVKEGSWGYRLLVVDDLDGNQLFFNYPNETASGKTIRDEA